MRTESGIGSMQQQFLCRNQQQEFSFYFFPQIRHTLIWAESACLSSDFITEKMSIWETGLKIYLFAEKFKKSCSWQFLYLDNLMQDDWCALKEC